MVRRLVVVVALVACRRSETTPAPPPAPSASAVAPVVSTKPMLDPALHVALLEEVAAVYAKRLPCAETEAALLPLRAKVGDAADPRVGAAIEKDPSLRARRTKALDVVMDGAMRCSAKDGG